MGQEELEKTRLAAKAKQQRTEKLDASLMKNSIAFRDALSALCHVELADSAITLPSDPLLLTDDETPAMAMVRLKGKPLTPQEKKKLKLPPKLDPLIKGKIDYLTDLCESI